MTVVTATVLSEGEVVDPRFQVRTIDIRREVNRISRAELVLADGDPARRNFPASDSSVFEPGKVLEIRLRWEGAGDETTVFEGLVVRHGIEADSFGTALVVEAKDAAIKLTGGRKSAVFHNKTDSDAIGDLVRDAGLIAGPLATTDLRHGELVQYRVTDWDFMLSRAEANGLLLAATDGELSLVRIEQPGPAVASFEWGVDRILDFEMEADAGRQFEAVESFAWDARNQKLTAAKRAAEPEFTQGNLDGAGIGSTLGLTTATLCHPVSMSEEELQAWANGDLARRRSTLLRGRLSVPGRGDLRLLDPIELVSLGSRFDGTTLLTGLRHRVDADGWRTDLAFGLPPAAWTERAERAVEAPAAGLLPAVSGLQIGIVAPFEGDPEHEMRVRVFLPAIDAERDPVWARLASPDAGAERGWVARPEAGDQVVLAFLNDDPRHPVILGALHGCQNTPPAPFEQAAKENIAKGWVTRSGATLAFLDDEQTQVYIETPNGNRITLDDQNEKVELADQHGNTVTLSQDGVTLTSTGDLMIDAAGKVEIKGSEVDVK